RVSLTTICLTALMVAMGEAGAADSSSLRAWTPNDSIGVRYISADQYESANWIAGHFPGQEDRSVISSPDGQYFFFLTHHGDLETDSNVYELEVFKVALVREWLGTPRSSRLHTLNRTGSLPDARSLRGGLELRALS